MLQFAGSGERLFFRSVKRNHGWWSVANWRMDAALSDRSAKNSLFRLTVNIILMNGHTINKEVTP